MNTEIIKTLKNDEELDIYNKQLLHLILTFDMLYFVQRFIFRKLRDLNKIDEVSKYMQKTSNLENMLIKACPYGLNIVF